MTADTDGIPTPPRGNRSFGFLRRHSARGRSRALQGEFREASLRITADLDSDRILKAVVEEIHRSLGFPWTSIWLVQDDQIPRLAFAAGKSGLREQPSVAPSQVIECALHGRPVQNEMAGMLAFPIITPLSGLVGVLYLQGRIWNVDEQSFLEAIVRQTGLTLEAAKMHERALAETRKSEAILERIADGVVVTDRAGVIAECNPAARRIVGSDSDPTGRRCEDVLGLHIGERALDCANGCGLLAAIRDASGDPGAQGSMEVWRALEGDARQPLLADVAPVGEGDMGLLVHSMRDITKLKQADEAKTMFLATASHELKTPLTVIGGFAQTLLHHNAAFSDSMRTDALQAIERRSHELTGIVNRLLLSSRIEAGRVDVTSEFVDVETVVRERVDAWRASQAHRIALTVTGAVPRITADPEAIATIVDHLVENAIKYSPGGAQIDVTIAAEENEVSIAVIDRGIGMDEETLVHCTEKFWQSESTDDRRFGGTGIGLYIVRSLVEAMGGRLGVESHLGTGSTFTIALRAGARELVSAGAVADGTLGEPSLIREFMKQIGVRGRRGA